MAWRLEVGERLRPFLQTFDPSLKEELIEHMARIADEPLAELRRGRRGDEAPDALVYEYESELIGGLRLRIVFGEVDVGARRLVLTEIAHSIQPPERDRD